MLMLLLAAAAAPAHADLPAEGTGCGLPEVLPALAGRAPAPFAHALVPPARLDGRVAPRPPDEDDGGKEIYGTPYSLHLETDNFTVNWWDSSIDRADARAAADALETAWDSFVAAGWTPPVSSDRFLLWVLLDPGLGGTTGYTTEYFTDDFAQGYPVIYLNPDYAWDDAFWASLAAHELMHAFQYAVRDYDGYRASETWYWEASATWGSELADPGVDGHHYIAEWYATQADLRYDSTTGSHQYGMFVLNAWLDEALGAGTMQEAWRLGQDRAGETWDGIIADAAGLPVDEVWGGFTGAFGNNGLAESAGYADPPVEGPIADGATGVLPYLGTHYWRVPEASEVMVEGPAVLGDADEAGMAVVVPGGGILAVTGLEDGAEYTLLVAPARDEDLPEGDTGSDGGGSDDGSADDGSADDGGSDGGGADDGLSGGSGGGDGLVDDDPKGGCTLAPAAPGAGVVLWGMVALAARRRRRGA